MIKLFLYDLALQAKIIRKSGVTDVLVLLASLELAVLLASFLPQKYLTSSLPELRLELGQVKQCYLGWFGSTRETYNRVTDS